MKKHYFSITIAAAALLGGLLAVEGFAVAQNKPIPDGSVKLAQSKQSFSDETFGGILTPPPDDEYGRPMPEEDPRGYQGLLPGTTPEYDWSTSDPNKPQRKRPMTVKPGSYRSPFAPEKAPVPKMISTPRLPKMSYAPWAGAPMPVLSSDDLKLIAQLNHNSIDINHLPPEMEKRLGLPEGTSRALNHIRMPRIDGMVPSEFAVKRSIDAVMSIVDGKSGNAQRKAAEAAYDRLSNMASGYRSMKAVPTDIYRRFGAGDAYLEDQQEGYSHALDRLEEALNALEKIK